MGFTKCTSDSNLYYKVEDSNPMILLLYVDDLFMTGMDGLITDTRRKLAAEFEMKDLGMMHYFLGMEVWQSREVCGRDLEEIWDDRLQGYDHTYGMKPEAIE